MSKKVSLVVASLLSVVTFNAFADCLSLVPDRTVVRAAIKTATANAALQGGYGLPMWVTIVDNTGNICGVWSNNSIGGLASAGNTNNITGASAGNSAWLGSRIISAQKAYTANAFSLDGYSIATGNLWAAVQGGSLFGLQHSNPVDASRAYEGNPAYYGTLNDPLQSKTIGGVNVFGGGLALYSGGVKVGAIGVSGDTSCRDHVVAWEIRHALSMDTTVPTGITKFNAGATGGAQTALKTSTNTNAIGDELIINATGAGTITGATIGAATGTAAYTYWNGWAQPACPNIIKHVSTIFIQ